MRSSVEYLFEVVEVRGAGSGEADGLREGRLPDVLRTAGVESLLDVTFSIAAFVASIALAKSSSIRLVSSSSSGEANAPSSEDIAAMFGDEPVRLIRDFRES